MKYFTAFTLLLLLSTISYAQSIRLKALNVKQTTVSTPNDINPKWSDRTFNADEFLLDFSDNEINWKDNKGSQQYQILQKSQPRSDTYKFSTSNANFIFTNLGNRDKYGFDYLVDAFISDGDGKFYLFRYQCNYK